VFDTIYRIQGGVFASEERILQGERYRKVVGESGEEYWVRQWLVGNSYVKEGDSGSLLLLVSRGFPEGVIGFYPYSIPQEQAEDWADYLNQRTQPFLNNTSGFYAEFESTRFFLVMYYQFSKKISLPERKQAITSFFESEVVMSFLNSLTLREQEVFKANLKVLTGDRYLNAGENYRLYWDISAIQQGPMALESGDA
jgi:hypothetical protein